MSDMYPGLCAVVRGIGGASEPVRVALSLAFYGDKGPKGDGWTAGAYDDDTGVASFESGDGLEFQTSDLRGADSTVPGPQGPQGEIGPEGPQGQKGDKGDTGDDAVAFKHIGPLYPDTTGWEVNDLWLDTSTEVEQ